MSKLFISCLDATTICTKSQYNEATLYEKVKLNLHLVSCKKCKTFAKQNYTLSVVCSKNLESSNEQYTLTDSEKAILRSKISKLNS